MKRRKMRRPNSPHSLKLFLAIFLACGMAGQINAQPMENNVPTVKLSNGVEMPQVGFGTLRLPQETCAEPALVDIGKKYGKSVAQVILRYLTQRGIVTLCRTDNPAHRQEDIDIFDFELTDAEMHAIDLLDKGHTMAKDHRAPQDVEWFHTKATR